MVQKVIPGINRVTDLNSIFEYNCYISRKQNRFVNCKRRQQYMQASNEKEQNCTSQLKQRLRKRLWNTSSGMEVCTLVFKATQEITLKGLKRKLVTFSMDGENGSYSSNVQSKYIFKRQTLFIFSPSKPCLTQGFITRLHSRKISIY